MTKISKLIGRETLNSMMKLFAFIPDKLYLRLMYRVRMGKKLNLEDPKTFNEKLQWLKLYNRKPEYTAMVDKYEAKEYVANKIGEKYIIPTLGVWDSFDEIDFNKLPNQFVLKCTHDSGGLVICRDKNLLDMNTARKKIVKSLKSNFYWVGREWPYKDVKPRIIAEQYIEDSCVRELRDYKIYCFNGKAKFLYLSEGMENHDTARISFVNLDWTPADFRRNDYKEFEKLPKKPEHLDDIIMLAENLAKNQAFIRVDFYEVNNRVYFGELTFFPGSGFTLFASDEDDLRIGQMLDIEL
ncbi:ATP-grasp fold amidoligase family protein [Blautia sp.]|uniref:ATP-grasp fold amidoligase family protein n=1 Tax=Blautia sp. TaxID=1955243 RepID=UPI003AB52A67